MGALEDFLSDLTMGNDQSAETERVLKTARNIEAQSGDLALRMFEIEKTIDSLVFQNQQLALLFRSLYESCLKKELFSKEEFRKIFDQIDLSDGTKDGRISKN